MSDIFNVSPPAWLQDLTHSDEKGLLGKVAGGLVAGGIIAGEHAAEPNEQRNWFQLLPQSIAEGKMSLVDPMWRLKLQQQQLGIAHTALGMQEMQQKIEMNAAELKAQAEDLQTIPAWMQDHNTPDSRVAALDRPVPKSAKWQRYMEQMDQNDIAADRVKTQGVLEKATFNGLKELSNAVDEISKFDGVKGGVLSAKIAPYAAKGQMPPPEILQEVAVAREGAKTKEYERQKEMFGIRSTPVAERYRNIADNEDALAEEARLKGDVASYQKHKQRADENRANAAPKTSTIETKVTPEGTVVTQSYGQQGKPPQAAVEKSISYETALEALNDVMKKIQPGDVGVAGFVGEHVFDRWLSSISEALGGPSYGSNQRVDDRTAIRNLRELLFQAFSPERLSGTGFSNADVKRLNELANGLDPSKGYGFNMRAFGEMRDLIVSRAKAQSERTGLPASAATKAPADLINEYNIAVDNLSRAVKESRLTSDQAYQQAQQLHKTLTESLQRFH